MNLDNNPTKEQLKELFKKFKGGADHILYVAIDGTVKIDVLAKNESEEIWDKTNTGIVQFRLKAFTDGPNFKGDTASDNDQLVERVFGLIRKNWAEKRSGCIQL